jgi:hypothetical protein
VLERRLYVYYAAELPEDVRVLLETCIWHRWKYYGEFLEELWRIPDWVVCRLVDVKFGQSDYMISKLFGNLHTVFDFIQKTQEAEIRCCAVLNQSVSLRCPQAYSYGK